MLVSGAVRVLLQALAGARARAIRAGAGVAAMHIAGVATGPVHVVRAIARLVPLALLPRFYFQIGRAHV